MRDKQFNLGAFLKKNAVLLIFVVLSLVCLVYSGQSVAYVMYELFSRLTRNAFIVLALIIPIVAGMGINFAITIGAMAAQIAALWITEWQIPGVWGFLAAMGISLPIGALFGYLIGNLLNKMKGQEMIGGMILGYFANGLYQLLFLFIFGNLIPLNTPGLVIKGSTGVANTIDLSNPTYGIKYAIDGLVRLPFGTMLYITAAVVAVIAIVLLIMKRTSVKRAVITIAAMAVCCGLYQIPVIAQCFTMVNIPVITYLLIALLCLFNSAIMKTRLGQQFRAVG